jgi:hypothetical protein
MLVRASKRLVFTDSASGTTRHISPALDGGRLRVMHPMPSPGSSTGPLPGQRAGSETYIVVDRARLGARIGADEYQLSEEDVLYFAGTSTRVRPDGVAERHCFVFGTPTRNWLRV